MRSHMVSICSTYFCLSLVAFPSLYQAALFDGELPAADADSATDNDDSVLRDAATGRRLAVTEAERTLVHVKRTLSSKLIALQVRWVFGEIMCVFCFLSGMPNWHTNAYILRP